MADETRIIEGFLTPLLTPAAFKAADEMRESIEKFNQDGGDVQVLLNVLVQQNRALVRAIGEVELRLGKADGTIISSS